MNALDLLKLPFRYRPWRPRHLALIAADGYRDKARQQRLVEYYVKAQLVPQVDFMQHPDIQAVYQDVRAIFS